MPAYVKIGDIKGEATDQDHKDWIIIEALSSAISRSWTAMSTRRARYRFRVATQPRGALLGIIRWRQATLPPGGPVLGGGAGELPRGSRDQRPDRGRPAGERDGAGQHRLTGRGLDRQ